ncbi:hypothetical protein C5Y96_26820 [Blastopirellula marina]|uniref:Uncharacterized protein n=1 Tax=Blastopirellula marina TaxID=124 RepID=A0A2S8EZP7_9BACT|nr:MULTISPECIES: hypothetical protein [Pirellulaceae]PQO25114.1 hypothetical protein C5Y96_26820 [Blastopirellula marina]RCS40965.1 hypothetical protein DTL36_26865 [Bremerella cremea]
MTQATNPYQMWLGLNVTGRPDCYTLLGLPVYEADTGKIMVAAQNAMSRASIPMAPADEPLRHTLLSEIQLAQNCLLDPAQKQAYDQQLQAYFSGQIAPAAVAQPATAAPAQAAAPTAPAANPSSDSSGDISLKAKKTSAATSAKSRAKNSAFGMYMGGVAILLLAAVAGGAYFVFTEPADEPIAQADPQPETTSPEVPAQPEEESTSNGGKSPPGPKSGKRPTSNDLANSIPGLGNPEDTMAGMPAMNSKPPEPKATAEDQAELKAALEAAWIGISEKDYAKSSIALDQVRMTPKTPEGKTDFDRVDQFVQDLMAYNKALNDGTASLRENEELTVGSTTFTISTLDDMRVVVRFAGQNKGYERGQLPEGFQRAIALSRLKGEDTVKQRIEASHLLLSPKADIEYIRELWTQSGADGSALAALEAGKKKYLAGSMVAANSPSKPTEMTSTPSETETTTPEPMMTAPAAASTANVDQLAGLMKQARQQVIDRNASAAQQLLAQAAPLVTSPKHQEKFNDLKQLADLNQQFWQAVSSRLTKLPADSELDVNGTMIRVVESDANRLVIRMNGENRRYTLADIPAGLAKFLAEQELPTQAETKKIIGAFLLVTPDGGADRAREEFATAFLPDEEIDKMVAVLTDPYQLADDLIEQANIPTEADISAPAAAFQEKWNSRIQSAQRLDDHAKIGQEMAAAAMAMPNGSPQQFAGFRYALAESARGGDFATCSQIIQDWHTRFAIDQGEWHLKAMQLAAGSSMSSKVHAAIAQHAIKHVPLLIADGQTKAAGAMLKLAEESATKARDKDLVEAVKQLNMTP